MISAKVSIVCVAQPSWDADYSPCTVQLLKQLAARHRILYVDYARTLKDLFRALVTKPSLFLGMLGVRPRIRCSEDGIFVLTLPPIIPSNWLPEGRIYHLVGRINGWVVRGTIKRAMARLGIHAPVVINAFQPGLGLQLFGRLNEKGNIYFCYDDIEYAPWCKRHGPRMEKAYIEQVDAVITTSEALRRTKSDPEGPPFHVVRNGVDYELFSKGVKTLPGEIEVRGSRKRIGFLGCIDFRMDIDLVERIVSQAPDLDFVFIGPVREKGHERRLRALGNVELLGAKKQAELPGILKSLDAAIIPFVLNGFTKGIYPMKVNEYLAAGLPVIMTPFADLAGLRGAVRVARTPNEFLLAVRTAIAKDSRVRKGIRQRLASFNSWKCRSEEFDSVISQVGGGRDTIQA